MTVNCGNDQCKTVGQADGFCEYDGQMVCNDVDATCLLHERNTRAKKDTAEILLRSVVEDVGHGGAFTFDLVGYSR